MKNIKILLNYNFNPEDLNFSLNRFEDLFIYKRRDSCFAFAYEKENTAYAIRDHVGIVPLYFRFVNNKIKFSTNLASLIDCDCHYDLEGLRYYFAFGTSKLKPLFKEIKIVPPGSVIKIDLNTHKIKIIYQYKIKPLANYLRYSSFNQYVDRLDELFLQAIKRTCRFDEVGLYLSGGIDSALTGIYLKKLGIRINAYTSAPWGKKSSEISFAKINVKKIEADNHYIDFLETKKYKEAISFIPNLYSMPHGTTAGIGISSLWVNTPIKNERQIYGAQNCDTITCSMEKQYLLYFSNFLPRFIKQKLHKNIKYKNILQNYLSFTSYGVVNDCEWVKEYLDSQFSTIELLSLLGLYVVYTPSDGELLSGPVIKNNILFSNPFYDMDIIDFFLRVPFRFRIAFSKKEKSIIYFDKIIFRKLAQKYLPKDLVWRKKGLTVSLNRDKQTKMAISDIPSKISDISLSNNELKFRGKILLDWSRFTGTKLNH